MSYKNLTIPKSLILVFDSSKEYIALIKEDKTKDHWEGSLNAIGGHIENGEDIYKSAQRECVEELGITQSPALILHGCLHVKDKHGRSNMMFVFSTQISRKTPLKQSSEGEIVWMNIKEVNSNKNIVEDIRLFIRIIATMEQGSSFSGTSLYKTDGTLQYIQIFNHP